RGSATDSGSRSPARKDRRSRHRRGAGPGRRACPSCRRGEGGPTMALGDVRGVGRGDRKGGETVTPPRNASLSIQRGEFLSLMGASGSGKTTLLNLIAGIDRPTRGEILVGGRDVTRMSRTQLAHWRAAHVGYIFQLYNLIPVLTAAE